MIGAHDRTTRDHTALHRFPWRVTTIRAAQARTSMSTDVIEPMQHSLPVTYDENALADDIDHQIIPGLGKLLLTGGAKPFATENPFLLQLEGIFGVVPAGWQRLLKSLHGRRQGFCVHCAQRS